MTVMTDERARQIKAAEEVIAFLARELDVPQETITPASRLRQDLGLDGEDAEYLIEAFGLHFDLDMSGLRINDYFAADAGVNPVLSYMLWIFGNGRPLRTLRVSALTALVVKKRADAARLGSSP